MSAPPTRRWNWWDKAAGPTGFTFQQSRPGPASVLGCQCCAGIER
jgi:hypothetical protein